MKFCSITPVKNCDLMYENEMVMLLAHLSEKYPEYVECARNNNNYKIMDNSIIELGSSFSLERLITEARKCQVNEIILPDVFQSGYETVELVKNSIIWLKNNGILGEFKLMAVCHGNGPKEFLDTFIALNNISELDVIGIPKINSKWMTSRVRGSESLCDLTTKEIHLLGCANSLKELLEISEGSKIRSIDTCLPSLLSMFDMNLWNDRKGLTIDLETTEVNLKLYNEIMKNINTILSNI